jgi:glutamine amidotransferase
MICITDYGIGNVAAFETVYKRLGVPAKRARVPADFRAATHLVLPGVGHFDRAMHLLAESGLMPTLHQLVCEEHLPVLGICVGMQMLSEGSDEGLLPGLNWIPGRVKSFALDPEARDLPSPHMGWNDVRPVRGKLLADASGPRPSFYFLHSYFFDAKCPEDVAGVTRYGREFPAAVSRGNVHGVQFHPEKSHSCGVELLRRFATL